MFTKFSDEQCNQTYCYLHVPSYGRRLQLLMKYYILHVFKLLLLLEEEPLLLTNLDGIKFAVVKLLLKHNIPCLRIYLLCVVEIEMVCIFSLGSMDYWVSVGHCEYTTILDTYKL